MKAKTKPISNKPRNHVHLAMMQVAKPGAHDKSGKAKRQQAKRNLHRELEGESFYRSRVPLDLR